MCACMPDGQEHSQRTGAQFLSALTGSAREKSTVALAHPFTVCSSRRWCTGPPLHVKPLSAPPSPAHSTRPPSSPFAAPWTWRLVRLRDPSRWSPEYGKPRWYDGGHASHRRRDTGRGRTSDRTDVGTAHAACPAPTSQLIVVQLDLCGYPNQGIRTHLRSPSHLSCPVDILPLAPRR